MYDVTLLGRALADPARVRVLLLLSEGELCVCELVDALEMSQSTLSSHLQTVRQAGLVATRKAGRWIYYALEPEHAQILANISTHYGRALDADARRSRDRARLAARLTLREDGCCVVSHAPLQLFAKGGEPHA